jgi:hypothetical protein
VNFVGKSGFEVEMTNILLLTCSGSFIRLVDVQIVVGHLLGSPVKIDRTRDDGAVVSLFRHLLRACSNEVVELVGPCLRIGVEHVAGTL